MIEVMVELAFACSGCTESIRVKLRCASSKHTLAPPMTAAIHVPCPHCMRLNRVTFDANGTVHTVESVYDSKRVPTPSCN